MRIQVLSDLHLEFHADEGHELISRLDPAGIDVLVLAGDITVGERIPAALGSFCERFCDARVLYVHGNHEFYGADRASVLAWTAGALEANANLTALDAQAVVVGGQRFLGAPLWFRHAPAANRYRRAVYDFTMIGDFEAWVYAENARAIEFFEHELREGDVVVTHHLPSESSVVPRFVGSPLNPFFVCSLDSLIHERKPALWIHGHTHASLDYPLGSTRVVCNPFGYAALELNPDFSDRCVIEIGDQLWSPSSVD
jgi:predicted phosphodiesterase